MPDAHDLGRLESRVEFLIATVERIEQTVTRRLDDHSHRLRGLETDAARLKGIGAVILVVWGLIVALINRWTGK